MGLFLEENCHCQERDPSWQETKAFLDSLDNPEIWIHSPLLRAEDHHGSPKGSPGLPPEGSLLYVSTLLMG